MYSIRWKRASGSCMPFHSRDRIDPNQLINNNEPACCNSMFCSNQRRKCALVIKIYGVLFIFFFQPSLTLSRPRHSRKQKQNPKPKNFSVLNFGLGKQKAWTSLHHNNRIKKFRQELFVIKNLKLKNHSMNPFISQQFTTKVL